jgi:hypothetical protein
VGPPRRDSHRRPGHRVSRSSQGTHRGFEVRPAPFDDGEGAARHEGGGALEDAEAPHVDLRRRPGGHGGIARAPRPDSSGHRGPVSCAKGIALPSCGERLPMDPYRLHGARMGHDPGARRVLSSSCIGPSVDEGVPPGRAGRGPSDFMRASSRAKDRTLVEETGPSRRGSTCRWCAGTRLSRSVTRPRADVPSVPRGPVAPSGRGRRGPFLHRDREDLASGCRAPSGATRSTRAMPSEADRVHPAKAVRETALSIDGRATPVHRRMT